MLKAIWFVFKVGLVVAAFVWLAARPGEIEIHWLGYDILLDIGFGLVVLLATLLILLCVHRFYIWLFGYPARLRAARIAKRQERGQRALTLGLSAAAAGDVKMAGYHAYRMRKFLPDTAGLTLLLEAQAAQLRGDSKAVSKSYRALMEDKDTAFLGLRGLMNQALETGNKTAALDYAYQARKAHPKQPWIARMVYKLELDQGKWNEAEKSLKALTKLEPLAAKKIDSNEGIDMPGKDDILGAGAVDSSVNDLLSDKIAMMVRQSDEALEKGQKARAEKLLRSVLKIDPSFIPAACRLASLFIRNKKRGKATKVIESSWKLNPHHDLVPLWDKLAPRMKPTDTLGRLRWFEKLVSMRPDSAESHMAAANIAITDALWEEAEQHLERAEELEPSARLYRLFSKLGEHRGKSEDARYWMEKAADAPADKVWTCVKTGRIYERWSPIAQPHGAFNTIRWDYPSARSEALDEQEELALQTAGLLGN